MFNWLAPLTIPLIFRAALTLVIAGATFSLLGVFIVTLNLTAIRFSLLHVGLLGGAVAAAIGFDPLLGAVIAIAATAFSMGPAEDRLKLAPAAVSAFFMTGSLALAFILFYKAGIPAMDVFSLFAGSVLTVRPIEALTTGVLGLAIVAAVFIFYREIQAVLYNRDFAAWLGIPARAVYYVLLGLTGVAIAVAIRLVGALLVDAIILLPAMAALPFSRSLKQALILSSIFGIAISMGGIGTSLYFDWPLGASVGAVGVMALAATHFVSRWRTRRRMQLPRA